MTQSCPEASGVCRSKPADVELSVGLGPSLVTPPGGDPTSAPVDDEARAHGPGHAPRARRRARVQARGSARDRPAPAGAGSRPVPARSRNAHNRAHRPPGGRFRGRVSGRGTVRARRAPGRFRRSAAPGRPASGPSSSAARSPASICQKRSVPTMTEPMVATKLRPSAGRRPSRSRSQVLAKRSRPKERSSSASRARGVAVALFTQMKGAPDRGPACGAGSTRRPGRQWRQGAAARPLASSLSASEEKAAAASNGRHVVSVPVPAAPRGAARQIT